LKAWKYDQILAAGKALGAAVPAGNALPVQRFCAYCGSQLKAGAAFCIQCGKGGAHSHDAALPSSHDLGGLSLQ